MNSQAKKTLDNINKYRRKVEKIKQLIREYVHENAALCDEVNEIQENVIIRCEERKFLLKKLCLYDPKVENDVEAYSNSLNNSTNSGFMANDAKKMKCKPMSSLSGHKDDKKSSPSKSSRKPTPKPKKKIVQPIPLDATGKPLFPIELGSLMVHSLGEVVSDRMEFHNDVVIYPIGYVSTKIYGSIRDPTQKCVYTCKISDFNGAPRFEIASDDNGPSIVGSTPDVCHTLLLQKINDSLQIYVVPVRPRGNDFFGLTHPTIQNLIQSSPGARKCVKYKWNKFEVPRNGEQYSEDTDVSLNYNLLQKSIEECKPKVRSHV